MTRCWRRPSSRSPISRIRRARFSGRRSSDGFGRAARRTLRHGTRLRQRKTPLAPPPSCRHEVVVRPGQMGDLRGGPNGPLTAPAGRRSATCAAAVQRASFSLLPMTKRPEAQSRGRCRLSCCEAVVSDAGRHIGKLLACGGRSVAAPHVDRLAGTMRCSGFVPHPSGTPALRRASRMRARPAR
jgi:hypothetical protein